MPDRVHPIPIEPTRGDAPPPRADALDGAVAATLAFEQGAAGIAVAGEDGRIVRANPAMGTILGRAPAELAGRTLLELTHPEDRGRHVQRVVRLVTGEGEASPLELRYLRPDGAAVWCRSHLRLAAVGGSARAFVATLEDITARRAAEERLVARAVEPERAARERAEAASREKSEFLATMSRELRAPLTAIAGYAELLQLGVPERLPAALEHHVARIQESQRLLQGLVESLAGFARLETGRVEYDVSDVLVEDALHALAGAMAPELRARGLAWRLDLPAPGLRVRADPEKLGALLRHLVANALRFSERGEVAVAVEPDDDERMGRVVRIRVSDEGRGIPEEQYEAIFHPFVQLDGTPAPRGAGFGLGLPISRAYALAMGGDLRVESRAGEGTTFTVVLQEGGRRD